MLLITVRPAELIWEMWAYTTSWDSTSGCHGGACITTNLATIVCVCKSTLYLSKSRHTLTQSKQCDIPNVRLSTYQSDEETLWFSWVIVARRT